MGCTFRESTEEGQYFAAFARVRLGHEAKLTAWMAERQVEFMGKPAAEWGYQMSALTLGGREH